MELAQREELFLLDVFGVAAIATNDKAIAAEKKIFFMVSVF